MTGRRVGVRSLYLAVLSIVLWHGPVAAATCTGDCDGSGDVTVDEIITMVGVGLDTLTVAACPAGDRDGNGAITIDEILTAVGNALSGCPAPSTPTPTPTAIPEAPCPQRNPLRNVYFGDLHVHTTYSFDAYIWDVRTTPSDAYRFARGEPLALPPLDAEGHGTRTVRLERPLDFTAVTDHSEFLGEIEACITPGSPAYDALTCQQVRAGSYNAFATLGGRMTGTRPRRVTEICGSGGQVCLDAAAEVWGRVQDAAAAAYDRCSFTSFVAYEYSRSPGASTMHRNVIFRNERVPFPISAFEQPTPQGLWSELQHTCRDAGIGCDVLAIPHNSNESNGRTFFVEYPGAQGLADERAQAQFRAGMEPLVEIYQHKGASECMNGISGVVGAPDEQCEFERRRRAPIEDCGDGIGQLGATNQGCVSRLDFVRGVLLAGLQERIRLGVNPYQLGIVGSTDTHNGTPGFTDEWTFGGHQGASDSPPAALLGYGNFTTEGVIFSPGALAGIWGEENSRSSLFDALRRRETFATSGTRLAVRVFGGWNLRGDLCENPNLVENADARGVPMGGVLAQHPPDTSGPNFVISALRDPGTAAHPGTKLQRLQVVKGWIANGEAHQRVYDVAGDANNGASVDLATCTPQGPGADALCTVWRDPDFNPAQHAFYYVRVLENPTCRWNTWVCNALPPEQRQPSCDDPAVPKTIQERAWTSPIWYAPDG